MLLGDAEQVDEGRFEKALLLDGDGDGAEAAGLPAIGARDFRLSAWVLPSTTAGTQVVAGRWGEAGARSFKLSLVNGVPTFEWSADGTAAQSLAAAGPVQPAWTKIAVERSGGMLILTVGDTEGNRPVNLTLDWF